MNLVELEARLSENLDAVQNLRFQQVLQQIEDSTQIRKMKREISQIKTVLREYQLGIRQTKSNN
jgi:ribosomal protein L29